MPDEEVVIYEDVPEQPADNGALTREEAQSIADDATRHVVDALGAAVASQAGTVGEVTGIVALNDDQFSRLSTLGAAQLHAGVFVVGFLALLLGAVVGVGLTMHWRSRNG